MAVKLSKELQILFGNNMKYSDFIDFFFAKLALKRTPLFEENRVY